MAGQSEAATATEPAIVDMHADGELGDADACGEATKTTSLGCESEPPAAQPEACDNSDVQHQDAADMLAQQLDQLVHSVSAVEELSRRAREAATNDLGCMTRWKPHSNSTPDGSRQACAIRDQAQRFMNVPSGRRPGEPQSPSSPKPSAL